jgi:hypothetical protein
LVWGAAGICVHALDLSTLQCLVEQVLLSVATDSNTKNKGLTRADILSIGLTVGVALSGIIQFFCITYPGASFVWWGSTVSFKGCDGLGCPLMDLPEVGYFGPGVSLARSTAVFNRLSPQPGAFS